MNPEVHVSTHHVHDDDLQLYILGRLSAAEIEVLERHVFLCPECTDRLSTTARIVGQVLNLQRDSASSDNRSEPRIRASDAGFLRSFSPLLPDRWPVQVVDVSKSGLGLLVRQHLAPGTLVQIQIGETFALGEVRYSKQITDHDFRTGILVKDVVGRKP